MLGHAEPAHDEVRQAHVRLRERPHRAPRSVLRVGAHASGQADAPVRQWQQAHVLRQAIDNYKQVKKLLREWEDNTERLIDAVQTDQP